MNIFTLQKDLLRLNQNPDLEVRAVLSPGREPASTDIILKTNEKLPYHAGVNFDNQGTRLVGRQRTSFSLRSTNFTGRYDSFTVNSLFSAKSSGQFVSYSAPLGTYGARAGFDLTLFEMKLGKEFSHLDTTGTTHVYTPHISNELYLSEDFQAYIDMGMNIKSIKKRSQGQAVTNDQLRIPYLSFDLTKTDSLFGGGQTSFSPRFSFGTEHFLGASSLGHPSASRPGTGGFFFKYEQALRRIQRAPFDSYISARSQFQAASHTLPSSEQLQLGGANSVRGYPEGEYLADIGVALSVEWFFPCAIFPESYKLPGAKLPLRKQLQFVPFIDIGAGRLRKAASGEEFDRFLMGAGAGVRFQFNDNLFLRVDWAEPLGDRITPGQKPSNLYITVQCEL